MPLGEAVVVAVSAPHREEAFEGAREAIDRIKAEAPIWKREVEAEQRRCLIVNFPGSPKSIPEAGAGIRDGLVHAVGLLDS